MPRNTTRLNERRHRRIVSTSSFTQKRKSLVSVIPDVVIGNPHSVIPDIFHRGALLSVIPDIFYRGSIFLFYNHGHNKKRKAKPSNPIVRQT